MSEQSVARIYQDEWRECRERIAAIEAERDRAIVENVLLKEHLDEAVAEVGRLQAIVRANAASSQNLDSPPLL